MSRSHREVLEDTVRVADEWIAEHAEEAGGSSLAAMLHSRRMASEALDAMPDEDGQSKRDELRERRKKRLASAK